jgi:hypothetical protein
MAEKTGAEIPTTRQKPGYAARRTPEFSGILKYVFEAKKMKGTGAYILMLLITLSLLPGCGLFSSGSTSSSTGTPSPATALKPKPSIVDVTASTSGQLDYYYAILEIAIKNDGAEGTVLLTATVTQGTDVKTREVPVALSKNAREGIRLVFPLKWKGGEWTPTVKVEVP